MPAAEPFTVSFVGWLMANKGYPYLVEVVRGPVEETYARTSVLVLPSVNDGFGLVVLEAMACGIPVILTDRCGAAEVVTEGRDGFVVPARDPEAIRARLVELHGDPGLRERMGREARATALRHPWNRFEDEMREIVRGTLPARSAGDL